MLGNQWSIVLVTMIATQLWVALYLYRQHVDETAGGTVDIEGDQSTCPDCSAENELGYRYCRSCVSELPDTQEFRRPSTNPLDGLTK